MGTLTTTNLAIRYPDGAPGAAPDVAGDIRNLAQDVEDRFGRASGSVGGLAAGTRYGQRAIVGSVEYRWNGSGWYASGSIGAGTWLVGSVSYRTAT